MADHIIVMQNGHVMEEGSSQQIVRNPQTDYTRKLLAAAPQIGDAVHEFHYE